MAHELPLVERLRQGTLAWNCWRQAHPTTVPYLRGVTLQRLDLGGVNLRGADLRGANLQRANLHGADLQEADLRAAVLTSANLREANLDRAILWKATLSRADMRRATLRRANLREADLSRAMLALAHLSGAELSHAILHRANLLLADLSEAVLRGADLRCADLFKTTLRHAVLQQANLSEADLRKADLCGSNLAEAILRHTDLREALLHNTDLTQACLVEADCTKASLSRCAVYGVSTWATKLEETQQAMLCLTPAATPSIAVDDLALAQFVALWLYGAPHYQVIDSTSCRFVLVLGHFPPQRTPICEALRDVLHEHRYLPIWCDSALCERQDTADLLVRLQPLVRFLLVDATAAPALPQMLYTYLPTLTMPVQPLLQGPSSSDNPWHGSLPAPAWMLPVYQYESPEEIRVSLGPYMLAADAKAEAWARLPQKESV